MIEFIIEKFPYSRGAQSYLCLYNFKTFLGLRNTWAGRPKAEFYDFMTVIKNAQVQIFVKKKDKKKKQESFIDAQDVM